MLKGRCSHVRDNSVFANCCACAIGKRRRFGSARGGRTWLIAAVALFVLWLGFRYIPNNSAGVVEKLWSPSGSVPEGQIVALEGEAGYQVELLRGGMHFGYWRWQYRVHKVRLVTIPQGKIGYVYARDGEPLAAQPNVGPARELQQLSRCPGVPRRQSPKATAPSAAASAAASAKSCAKVCTPSTRPCLS